MYLVRDTEKGWRIEDDGNQVPMLEACGVDLGGKSRGEAFGYLLREFGVQFDSDERTLHSPSLSEAELGAATILKGIQGGRRVAAQGAKGTPNQ